MCIFHFICHLFTFFSIFTASGEISDGTVCFDNCNNHGECIDYTCNCHIGYHGDDCSTTFVNGATTSSGIISIFGAGHYNLTIYNYSSSIAKALTMKPTSIAVVGFSSSSCYKCIRFENEYDQLSNRLLDLKIPLFRADADSLKDMIKSLNIIELPALVIYYKKNKAPLIYTGIHEYKSILTYIYKLMSKSPIYKLNSIQDVASFLYSPFNYSNNSIPLTSNMTCSSITEMSTSSNSSLSLSESAVTPIKVIGFFQDTNEINEDEYKDFIQVATEMKTHEMIYFGAVTKKSLCNEFKTDGFIKADSNNNSNSNMDIGLKNKLLFNWISKIPSVCLILPYMNMNTAFTSTIDSYDFTSLILQLIQSTQPFCISFDELYYGEPKEKSITEQPSLSDWILNNAVPLVTQLTPFNFVFYEKSNKPMLMLFLDLTYEHHSTSPLIIGGKSGNILNQLLINEFKSVAKEYYPKIFFVYIDGLKYPEQMKKLGLKVASGKDGVSQLPSMAFNTKENIQLPFPNHLVITKETINQFCSLFLNGHFKSASDIEKKMQITPPIKPHLETVVQETVLLTSQPIQSSHRTIVLEQTKGVLEFFGDEELLSNNENKNDNEQSDMLLLSNTDSSLSHFQTEKINNSVHNILKVTKDTFHSLIIENDDMDVLLLFYATDNIASGNFIVFYKKLCLRLFELNTSSTLLLTRMDVTVEMPPLEYQFFLGSHSSSSQLPALVLIPGMAKYPPWKFYSGRGQSFKDMLTWVVNHVTHKFEIPTSLPHLTNHEKELYKEQMHEREAILIKQASRDRITHSKEEYDMKMNKYKQRVNRHRREANINNNSSNVSNSNGSSSSSNNNSSSNNKNSSNNNNSSNNSSNNNNSSGGNSNKNNNYGNTK